MPRAADSRIGFRVWIGFCVLHVPLFSDPEFLHGYGNINLLKQVDDEKERRIQ